MLRIPWSTDIGLAHPQICVTLISLIAWSRSPTISAAKRLGGQRSRGISLPSWKLSHLFYIGVLAFIFSKTRGPVHSLMAGAQGTDKGPGEEFSSCQCYSPSSVFKLSSQMKSLWKERKQPQQDAHHFRDIRNMNQKACFWVCVSMLWA